MKRIKYIWFISFLSLSVPEIYSKSINIFPANSDSLKAHKLMQEADSLYEHFLVDEAIEKYKPASEVFQKLEKWENAVYCMSQIGDCYRRKGEYKKAQKLQKNSIILSYDKLGEMHFSKVYCLLGLARLNQEIGQYDLAIAQIDDAIVITKLYYNSNYYPVKKYLAELYYQLGIVHFELGNIEQAFENTQKAIALYSSEYNAKDLALGKYLNILAIIYTETGKFEQALKNYEKCIEIVRNTLGDENPHIALLYQNIAIILGDHRGDHSQAMIYYQNALRINSNFYGENHFFTALIYYNIGSLYEKMFAFEKALKNYNKSLSIYESLVGINHTDVAMCHRSIGDVYKGLNKYQHAYDYYSIALSIHLKLFGIEHPEVAKIYNSLGEIKRIQNQAAGGMKFHIEALETFEAIMGNHHFEISKTYNLIGLNYAARKNHQLALDNYQKSIVSNIPQYSETEPDSNPELSGIISEPILLETFLYKIETFSELYESTRDIQYLVYAFNTYKTAVELIDKMKIGYRAEESKQFLANKSARIYEDAINLSLKLFRLTNDDVYKNQAYLFSQKSKAGILLEAMNESNAKKFADIPDSLLERESDLRHELTYQENRLYYSNLPDQEADSTQVAEIKDRVFSLNREYTALVKMFEDEYPRYYIAKYTTGETEVSALTEMLDKNECLIEYFVGADSIYAFYFTKDTFTIVSVENDKNFNSLIESYYSSIKKINSEQYIYSAYELYSILLKPQDDLLRDINKLVIIPDGNLHYMPFEALLTSKKNISKTNFTDLDYLLDRFTISYNYSASLLSEKSKDAEPSDYIDGLIGFAPVFTDQYKDGYVFNSSSVFRDSTYRDIGYRFLYDNDLISPLPYSEEELSGIITLFEDHNKYAVGYFFNEASKKNFLGESAGFKYVHVASHSYIHPDKPQFSGILLHEASDSVISEKDIILSNEIYNMDLNADLVTLSSCESGTGKFIRGEGIMALTRGFLYAGSNNILTSLWKVLDKSTAGLMNYFYDSVLSGNSYAEALREAKLNMIKNEDTAFPLNWSGFVLIGN